MRAIRCGMPTRPAPAQPRRLTPQSLTLRDVLAVCVVGVFVFPMVWWGLTAVKPADAILDLQSLHWLDFAPTFSNFAVTVLGAGESVFDSRSSLIDSCVVSVLATLITLLAALPMGYALAQFSFSGRSLLKRAVLLQRFVPPIALVFPLVGLYHTIGLVDSRIGVALVHATLNLPLAVLMLASFFEDLPPEVSEAALLDGASRWQLFARVLLPLIKGGVAATAVLVFIFSWTEFLMALFLTQNMRLVPVQAAILVLNMWGLLAAFTTAALVPAFLFILLAQRHLVRGLTMGIQR